MNGKTNGDQLESTNNNIIEQDRGGLVRDNSNSITQVVNPQTENAECENSNESQFLKDAS
ncbi:12836_t:CDS:1, partial [Acaulospora morrowiae]